MTEDASAKIRDLLFVALRNMAHLLLKAGVDAREFIEIGKSAYVEAAAQRFGDVGKPASISRIAEQTGLTRREVKRLREKASGMVHFSNTFAPTHESITLQIWHTDARYLDARGEPLPLPIGPGPVSLTELIESCRFDLPVSTVIGRLKGGNLVHIAGEDMLQPSQRNVTSPKTPRGIAVTFDTSIVSMARTIAHNLDAPPGDGWIQRTVYSNWLDERNIQLIRRAVRSRAKHFCESIDDFFAASEGEDVVTEPTGENGKRAGIGVFYFEDDPTSVSEPAQDST